MNRINPHFAARVHDIEPFHVMELLARARQLEHEGRTIVHMEVGEPDFATAEPIIRAGQRALAEGHTGYSPALGLPALREAIAGHYARRYGVAVDSSRIIITSGGSAALQLALGVLVDIGNEVLLTDPGYPCNRHFVRLFEGHARNVPVHRETRYQLTAELLRAHWTRSTVAALVSSPANPTGTLIDADEMAAMAAFAAQQGGTLLVDEIYHGLVYGADAPTALALSDDVFVLNSFSKYFGMTGWRLGWIVVPDAYVRAVEKLQQNIYISAAKPAQHAALAAFTPEAEAIFEARREAFRERRDYLLPALRGLGFDIPVTPDGAFYLYANCARFGVDSFELSKRLLEEVGVAVTPGIDFGEFGAAQHLRFAYTTGLDQLREGVARLERFLGSK
ncbi:pyridoxal phosphate-dependent aminotransferase [Acidihalobacter ferrooxydans]|uniref:Aminotransferase n=1 Tax=Acidihalobacter ferrooxydans TaxID=1765967 RepID=A0A1P8UH10_9GAMM|nr:pyridoxal phosphate-dependent aminotransferase [Acidihalobacter ferrooxydans]APZ43071.1 aminotransferase [Acidihalobacter ferrooxydans]